MGFDTRPKGEQVARDIEGLTGADRLDVTKLKNLDQIASGGYVGAISYASGMTQFANAKQNQYWKAETAGSIGGLTFVIGDKLVCRANVTGTPVNLTDSAFWAREANLSAVATTTQAGTVRVGDALSVQTDGLLAVKVGAGLTLDASKNVVTDNANIDVFTLKNVGLLNKGNYRGDIPATAAGLANAAKGDWWKSSVAKSLLGTSFATGDELYCVNAQVGTPTDLSNFVKVANTQSVMIGASAVASGVTGTVPVPAAGDNSKAMFGDATYKAVIQPTDVNNTLVSTATDKPLSAAQGKALKDAIDALPSNANPLANGVAAQGASSRFSRQDHVHPTDTTRAPLDSATLTGAPSAPTPAVDNNTTRIATTAYVIGQAGANTPLPLGTGAVGTSLRYARQDHVHPLSYVKAGADFTVSTAPTRVFRDFMWTSGNVGTAVQASAVPWIVSSQDDADRLAAFWLQNMVTFFKNLENDNQYDQMLNWFSVADLKAKAGGFQTLSGGTDMDNTIYPAGAGNYSTEWFELIVAANSTGTVLYTMWFNNALYSTGATDGSMMYPYRCVYQTTRDQALTSFPTTAIAAIPGASPKTTARGASFTPPAQCFSLMAEPISIETRR